MISTWLDIVPGLYIDIYRAYTMCTRFIQCINLVHIVYQVYTMISTGLTRYVPVDTMHKPGRYCTRFIHYLQGLHDMYQVYTMISTSGPVDIIDIYRAYTICTRFIQ